MHNLNSDFRAYWKDVILEYICTSCPNKELSIKFFSEEMGINPNDIVSTLQGRNSELS